MLKHIFPSRRMAQRSGVVKASVRAFGAMDEIDYSLFDHKFTSDMTFQKEKEKMKCFRVIDHAGNVVNPGGYEKNVDNETLLKIYNHMLMINEADVVFNQAQRQSRISFYMTQLGEEAATLGCMSAMKDQDMIFPQYRESAAIYWRGFTIQDMADQLVGNYKDLGGGKQMPIHYGSKALNFSTVSSPLCT